MRQSVRQSRAATARAREAEPKHRQGSTAEAYLSLLDESTLHAVLDVGELDTRVPNG